MFLISAIHPERFRESKHAMEKECLRVDQDGLLSKKPHPKELGSTLFHPMITTDFSEAQPELITPTYQTEKRALKCLHDLESFIYSHLKDELIWPFSTPCPLPDVDEIPIAQYGPSMEGMRKTIYRKGLTHRYGKKMQTLSGIHYNFSFSERFWEEYRELAKSKEDLQTFRSEMYLGIVRNFLKFGWLNSYLFGATPACDETFFDKRAKGLKRHPKGFLFHPDATSIRTSSLGYYNRVQSQLGISYNTIDEFIDDLNYAVTTSHDSYRRIGVFKKGEYRQLNDCYLQIENELYSRIRPKPFMNEMRILDSLREGGVHYVEIRGVDIYPFVDEEIELDQLYFLHLFLIYCLSIKSPPLTRRQRKQLTENQDKVALMGKRKGLKLAIDGKTQSLKEWGTRLLEEMYPLAEMLDMNNAKGCYQRSLSRQFEKINDPGKTPSSDFLDRLLESGLTFRDFGLEWAHRHRDNAMEKPLSKKNNERLEKLASLSLEEKELHDIHDDLVLEGYEDLEISTQMLLRECIKRGVSIEELDRHDHLFRLSKGKVKRIVKQATMTEMDSLISYLIMENKLVSKQVLYENGISVPIGEVYTSSQKAVDDYQTFEGIKVAVKPNHTNYGIGISFVGPHQPALFKEAVKQAFIEGNEVIVEAFCEGEEYRILVIGGRAVACCQRIAANITGDGKHTVKELVRMKNKDPYSYKIPKYYLRLGKEEKQMLRAQRLSPDSVLRKGRMIFLRSNSNVSTGGDSIDMTDRIHEGYKKIAVKAAASVNAAFCGVDLIIKNPKTAPTNENYSAIEINFNPALWIHRYPIKGEKRYVEKTVLDELGLI